MKTLITISFVLDFDDEDELVQMARTLEKEIADGFRERMKALPEGISEREVADMIEFYGSSLTLRQDIIEVMS